MFDKLVESDTAAADFKNRSRYFMVSSVVVGILFLTAVVYSLYAAEVGLGNGNFDIAELLPPVEMTEPEPPKPPERSNSQQSEQSALPVRTDNIARIDEAQFVPDKPSVVPSNVPSRPVGRFIIDPNGTNSSGIGGPTGLPSGVRAGSGSSSTVSNENDRDLKPVEPPPPVTVKPPPVHRKSTLLNSSAIYLPKPPYPRLAGTLNLEDTVNVQVMIDEKGNVISAKAASGHPFFRSVSEQAARNAKFSPTILNGVPVKVTGVIVYRFKRS